MLMGESMPEGYPNEGPDSRIDVGGILKWAQNNFSFYSKDEPHWFFKFTGRFQYQPGVQEYVVLGAAWPPYAIWQGVAEQGKIVSVPVSAEHPGGLAFVDGKVTMVRGSWLCLLSPILLWLLAPLAWYDWLGFVVAFLFLFLLAWRYDTSLDLKDGSTRKGGYIFPAVAIKIRSLRWPMQRGF